MHSPQESADEMSRWIDSLPDPEGGTLRVSGGLWVQLWEHEAGLRLRNLI